MGTCNSKERKVYAANYAEEIEGITEAISQMFSSSPPTFMKSEFCELPTPANDDLLLAMKMAALNNLAYWLQLPGTEKEDTSRLEREWLQKVGATDFQRWYAAAFIIANVEKHLSRKQKKASHETLGGSAAFTCVLNDLTPELLGPSICVCFRGTQSLSDMVADLTSLEAVDFVTSQKKNFLGKTGKGFVTHLKGLLKEKIDGKNLLEHVVGAAQALRCRVIVTGHSLGGGLATLFAAELHADYKDQFPLMQVTFGSPRVFVQKAAVAVDQFPYRKLRYVNDTDLITTLGDEGAEPLHHVGSPHFLLSGGDNKLVVVAERNFPPNPSHVLEKATLVKTFLHSKCAAHLMRSRGGYIDKMLSSTSYKEALSAITDEGIRDSFTKIYSDFKPT